MKLKRFLVRTHWIMSEQFGFDPLKFFKSLMGLPFYVIDFFKFRSKFLGKINLVPCLHDRFQEGGATKGEYFLQDLLIAQMVFSNSPSRHVDVGSRIDGFVAHVASFRDIEVFDVRPITTKIPGVIFKQADLMGGNLSLLSDEYCDSISCLHAIEHFGLGRYGDQIDVLGFSKGIANIVRLLKSGGRMYLSTPIGIERVEFNANWIFNPRTIISEAEKSDLILDALFVINNGVVNEISAIDYELDRLGSEQYNLGIFIFIKNSNSNSNSNANANANANA
jgi:hypothetical protein